MGIESICDCCSTFFQSCSAFYRYIKLGCNALEKITIAEMNSNPPFIKPIFALRLNYLPQAQVSYSKIGVILQL